MIIKKMTAWFGALEGKSLELGEGLNILYAPNESGKSTWCAFLRDMLYGVDTSQRVKQGQQPDKVKYRPWSGASMSGSMDIETADGPVTLRRWTERANQPMQAFSANLTGTDTPVAGLTAEDAGQMLTGAPREVFERSAFIYQMGLGLNNDPELEKRFAAIVSAGDEEQSYSETDKRLRAWQRHRSGRKGAIGEADGEIGRIRRELEQIELASRSASQLEQELELAQTRQKELVRRMEHARAEARKKALADLAAAREAVKAAEDEHRQAEEEKQRAIEALGDTPFDLMGPKEAERQAREDMDRADELARQAAALPPMWLCFIPLVLAAALLVLGVVLRWKWLWVGLAGVGVTAGGVYAWLKGLQRQRDELLDQRQEMLEGYGIQEPEDMDGLLDDYDELWQSGKDAEKRLKAAQTALKEAHQQHKAAEEPVLNGLDFVHGDSEAARASRAVTEGQERMERLKEQRAIAEGRARAMGDEMVLRSELETLKGRREALLAQEEALQLAIQTMSEADLGLREKFSPVLAEKAAALFGQLTGGRYDEITLARDLSAKARLAGHAVGWEADYLSQGARDQLYLALRLAVCELVLPEEQACPIILDDALAAFDQKRMERALELLKSVAEKRQVLVFSCHEREKAYFDDDDAVKKIRLG